MLCPSRPTSESCECVHVPVYMREERSTRQLAEATVVRPKLIICVCVDTGHAHSVCRVVWALLEFSLIVLDGAEMEFDTFLEEDRQSAYGQCFSDSTTPWLIRVDQELYTSVPILVVPTPKTFSTSPTG